MVKVIPISSRKNKKNEHNTHFCIPLDPVFMRGGRDGGRFMDDSTSAVDTATDARIRSAFAERIPGTTKLIIAQRISSVRDADRIAVLDNGKLNGFGSHEELLESNAIYREIYEGQTGGGGDFDQQPGAGIEETGKAGAVYA